MGEMRRAEARERAFRERVVELRPIIIAWKRIKDDWRVDFMDAGTRRYLTRPRVYKSAEPVRGFVARSMTELREGPRKKLFIQGLEKGAGEIEVEITATQYERLTSS